MTLEIKVPTLGESVTEATVGQWLKKEGDAVARDEPLVELETDKVTLEVPAPAAGRLEKISVKDGETVGVGALLGMIAEGEAGKAAPIQAGPETTQPRADAKKGDGQQPPPAAPMPSKAKSEMPPAPSAAKLMQEKGLSAEDVAGSGKRGQVLKGDVLEALSRAPKAPAPPQARAPSSAGDMEREERVKMTRLRLTIARRLKEAQNSAAMLTTFNDVDMSAVMDLRKTYRDVFEKKHGVRLGFMGFFVKACVNALAEIPAVNAEIDGDELVYKNYYHIGVAVGTEKGLVVPVIRDAQDAVDRRCREGDQRFRQARPRRTAQDRGDAGRHLHHYERRRLRLADVDADPECPAIRHSRHAPDRRAAGRAKWTSRDPPDDVSCPLLRPPDRRRPRGGDLPGARQGGDRGPAAAGARSLSR